MSNARRIVRCRAVVLLFVAATNIGCASGDDDPTDGHTDGDAGTSACSVDAECAGTLGELGSCRRAACVDGACVALDRANEATCAEASCAGVYYTARSVCVFGSCVAPAPVVCEGGPCAFATCDPTAGCTAEAVPDGVLCDADDSLCTPYDSCAAGICFLAAERDCDDDNPCTTDTCEPLTGDCRHEDRPPAPCDDDNKCTATSSCVDGVCLGEPIYCLDDQPCTEQHCSTLNGCISFPVENCKTTGNPCPPPPGWGQVCDDENACTVESCSPTVGCYHEISSAPCDDGSVCTTGDTCSGTVCLGKVVDCSDGNPCTDEACDDAKGCVFGPTDDACDDDDVCTTGDHCVDGICTSGAQVKSCDDGNPCTLDTCGPFSGLCAHEPMPDAANCDG